MLNLLKDLEIEIIKRASDNNVSNGQLAAILGVTSSCITKKKNRLGIKDKNKIINKPKNNSKKVLSDYINGESIEQLSKKYKVTRGTIYQYIYKHVSKEDFGMLNSSTIPRNEFIERMQIKIN